MHSPNNLCKENSEIQIKLNRLKARKSSLETQLKKSVKSERRARTRTLIQMGGLINLTNLPTLSHIKEGDDLQSDVHAMDNAAILLGMLLTFQEQLPPTLSTESYNHYKNLGTRMLKNQSYNRKK